MQLNPGDILDGRYRIEAPIARGGMSTVYRCIDTRLGRHVAAKVMDERYSHDPIFSQRFRREARSMAQLSHPNLVGVYDFSADGSEVFLIMELITGGTLRELLAEHGSMPPYAAIAIVQSILQGLTAVHGAGMVHRDLKPDNVLIDANHTVKLSDFGLVRAASASHDASKSIVGTVSYLSPEQVNGDTITTASDVYSTGIVLFELLTGTTPFHGDSELSHAYARLDTDVPAPSSVVTGVPKLIDELVATATARNPDHRFRDAGEFLSALNDVADALQLPEYTVPIPRNAAAHRAASALIAGEMSGMVTTDISTEDDDAPTTVLSGQAPEHQAQETSVFPPVAAATAAPAAAPTPPPPLVETPPATPPVSNRGGATYFLWWVFIAMITTAVVIGAWWFGSGRYGEVPQVLGMDQAAATEALSNAGFQTTLSTVYDNDVPIDLVAGSDPAGGNRAVKGDPVTVLVSLGKPTVPDLAPNATIDSYREALASRSLTMTEGAPEFSDTVPTGNVASVDPGPGSEVLVGSAVTVHVSQGPAPVNVPNVREEPANDARTALERAGFTVTVESRFDGTVRGDHAIGTSPEAGTSLAKGSTVIMYVSSASEVPELGGLSEQQARSQLADLGIRVESVTRSSDRDAVGDAASEVFTTNPPAGTLIDNSQTGVTVELVREVNVPNVIGRRLSEARAILREAGFRVKAPSSASGDSFVYLQSPTSFERNAPDSVVELRVFD